MASKDIYRSNLYKCLYYSKKSIKELLADRSNILKKIPLKLHRDPNQQPIVEEVMLLFKEHPASLDGHQILVLKEGAIHYIFFSCDQKYVPVCKRCLASVYITLKTNKGRIVCCNSLCKQSLLEQFEIKQEEVQKSEVDFQIYNTPDETCQKPLVETPLSEEVLEKIRRAARKILEE